MTATDFKALRVKNYMSTNPETLTPEDRLLDADLLIRRAGVRHIPVMSEGKLAGLLTDRDVRRYAPSILDSTPEEYNRIFEQTRVSTVMTRDVSTISPDATLAEAVAVLYGERRGCLPVVDGGQLIGILTRRDVLRFTNEILNPELAQASETQS